MTIESPCSSPGAFALGQTVITSQALRELHPVDVWTALQRHASRDWGDCGPADAQANEEALVTGCRLLSVYQDRAGTRFWIITEADRSATTVLLPDEY